MLAPFYGTASTEIYGDVRPQPIVIGVDVPLAPLLINLQHTIELCGLEPQASILEAVKTMAALCMALGAIAEDAWEEGWTHVAVEEALQAGPAARLSGGNDVPAAARRRLRLFRRSRPRRR